jgi:hypothetical protein
VRQLYPPEDFLVVSFLHPQPVSSARFVSGASSPVCLQHAVTLFCVDSRGRLYRSRVTGSKHSSFSTARGAPVMIFQSHTQGVR